MNKGVILDTGPLVAFMDRAEQHHAWACEQFQTFQAPFLTCEAVLTECLFLLRRLPAAQAKLLHLAARGALRLDFRLNEEIQAIAKMQAKYQTVPMSLADSCLVRMAEMTGYPICTLDSDFLIYRKRDGHPIDLITP